MTYSSSGNFSSGDDTLLDILTFKLIFLFLKSDIIFGIDKQDINEIYEVQNDN